MMVYIKHDGIKAAKVGLAAVWKHVHAHAYVESGGYIMSHPTGNRT